MIMRGLIGLVIVAGLARLAVTFWPLDAGKLHRDLTFTESRHLPGGVERVIPAEAPQARLRALHAIITATPRTKVLAGDVEAGHISYVTRSLVMGFPDITTLQVSGDQLLLRAHLVIGQSDLGVNARRVEGWLE